MKSILFAVTVLLTANSAFANPNVVCHFHYRASVYVSEFQQTEVRIPLNCTGLCMVFPAGETSLGDFSIDVSANSSVHVAISDRNSNKRISSMLFQFGDGFNTNNSTHGFTGLHYVYNPTSGAEMQWSCRVVDDSGRSISECVISSMGATRFHLSRATIQS